jgi:hypothetical protein
LVAGGRGHNIRRDRLLDQPAGQVDGRRRGRRGLSEEPFERAGV